MIKVDTGMSRNGCQPEELDSIMNVSIVSAVYPFCLASLLLKLINVRLLIYILLFV